MMPVFGPARHRAVPGGGREPAQSHPMSSPQAATDSRSRAVPRRTAAGQAELIERSRELTQRQRTVLFLVDGQRHVDEIRALAEQAGAGAKAFAELVALGLVWAPGVDSGGESSLLPSSHSLLGDTVWSVLDDETVGKDRPLDEARELLLKAVRSQAPLAGALTLLRLKRAATREALEALLDEVEQRLRKPHRSIIAAQTLRHVRHLLTLPASSRPPAA
jgi:hypothetical protein